MHSFDSITQAAAAPHCVRGPLSNGVRRRPALYPFTLAVAIASAALSPPLAHASSAQDRPDDPPPRGLLSGLVQPALSSSTGKVTLTLDLRGAGDSELHFGAPVSCKLGLKYVTFTPEDGHQYTIVPLKNGASGMAPYCDKRLFQSAWLRRAPGEDSPAYQFREMPPAAAGAASAPAPVVTVRPLPATP